MAIKLVDTLAPLADFPVAMAEYINFSDGESLQEKLDKEKLGSSTIKVSISDTKPTYIGTLGEFVFNNKQGENECVGWIYTPFGWYSFGSKINNEEINVMILTSDGYSLVTSDGYTIYT